MNFCAKTAKLVRRRARADVQTSARNALPPRIADFVDKVDVFGKEVSVHRYAPFRANLLDKVGGNQRVFSNRRLTALRALVRRAERSIQPTCLESRILWTKRAVLKKRYQYTAMLRIARI